ncbi:MAG: serine dehydratase beta chain [Evtepia gabavorous]
MNVFDIIGPIMIGPSSSHTAGAVRLGQIARKILGEDVVQARIELSGSFARTYRGHGTDKALLAGIMGLCPDDTRIRCSPAGAREGISSLSWRQSCQTHTPIRHASI